MTESTPAPAEQQQPVETPIDHDSPLWNETPQDDTPDEGAEPTGAPPQEWDQDAHTDAYAADPQVDTSQVEPPVAGTEG
jgi:hypothetical protein